MSAFCFALQRISFAEETRRYRSAQNICERQREEASQHSSVIMSGKNHEPVRSSAVSDFAAKQECHISRMRMHLVGERRGSSLSPSSSRPTTARRSAHTNTDTLYVILSAGIQCRVWSVKAEYRQDSGSVSWDESPPSRSRTGRRRSCRAE